MKPATRFSEFFSHFSPTMQACARATCLNARYGQTDFACPKCEHGGEVVFHVESGTGFLRCQQVRTSHSPG